MPEREIAVVTLAVDVTGDCATDGDESRAGRDRNEEPMRHDAAEQLVETHPGVDGGCATDGVNPHRIGRRLEPDDRAATVLCRVAVRPSETASNGPAAAPLDGRKAIGADRLDVGRGRRGSPPAREQLPVTHQRLSTAIRARYGRVWS